MRACIRFDDKAYSGLFAVEQGLRQGSMLAPLLLTIFVAVVVNAAYTRFKVNKDIIDAFVHLRKKTRGGGSNERGARPGDVALGYTLR